MLDLVYQLFPPRRTRDLHTQCFQAQVSKCEAPGAPTIFVGTSDGAPGHTTDFWMRIFRAFTFPFSGGWRNCAQISSRDATVGHEAVRPLEIPGPPHRFWELLFVPTRHLIRKMSIFDVFCGVLQVISKFWRRLGTKVDKAGIRD